MLSPKLYGRGKHVNADFVQIESVWDAYPHSTFYAHWKEGLIQQVYLDPDELIDIQNFKRSLISLFQQTSSTRCTVNIRTDRIPSTRPKGGEIYARARVRSQYTRSLQFQVAEGQRNETDATGQCEVQYEAPSETTVRKVKVGR
ncbi:jg9959, partial [Pararge aegeria aegeria]